MASRLVLVLGDLFIPDRTPVRWIPFTLARYGETDPLNL